jgi:hypothetical protein
MGFTDEKIMIYLIRYEKKDRLVKRVEFYRKRRFIRENYLNFNDRILNTNPITILRARPNST